MNNGIVADGESRFLRGKKMGTMESIEKKYAKELASAGPAQKAQIYALMLEDYSRRQPAENHKPSAYTLW